MESFFFRYRNPLVLLAILVAQIVGLAVQVRHTDSGATPSIRRTARRASHPPLANQAVSPPSGSSTPQVGHRLALAKLHRPAPHQQQNEELQKTIDRLRLEQASLLEDAKQGERLQALVDFQQKYIYKTVAAQAIGSSGSDQSRLFYIDKGADYKLERDMAVITPMALWARCAKSSPTPRRCLRSTTRPAAPASSWPPRACGHSARQRHRPAADHRRPRRPAHSTGEQVLTPAAT